MTDKAFSEDEFSRRATEAHEALRKKFGGKPESLEVALRKAGRRLPRGARRAGDEILAAQQLAGHPKLRNQIDAAKVDRAFDKLLAGVKQVDLKERRKGWVIGALASLAFNFLLFFVLIVLFARWKGWL